MKTSRSLIALTAMNVVLLLLALAQQLHPAFAQAEPPVLRGRALEIVDGQGRVRASISVLPPGKSSDGEETHETVLLRLITDMRNSSDDHVPPNWLKARVSNWFWSLTPTCKEVVRLTSEGRDHPLPLRTRIAMRIHYLICVWCERYRDQLGLLRKAMKSCPEKGTERGGLSSEARTRLKIAAKPKP